MKNRQKGMTLAELIVYMALAVLASTLLWAFQNITRSTQKATTASYLVSGATETCIEWIRRDVNESALASIRAYPENESSTEAPGMSLVSNRAFAKENRGKPLVNSWGAPLWDKHVFYSLQTSPGENTGNLIRWEKEIANKNLLPIPSEVAPSMLGPENSKVLLRDVLAPNVTVSGVGPGGGITTDEFGGFRSQFLRRLGGSDGEEMLTTVNPTAGNPRDNTRMMEFELKILQDEKNYYSVEFRVAALH